MEKNPNKKDSSDFFFTIASLILLSALVLFCYHVYFWLKYGVWQKIPVWIIVPSDLEIAIINMKWKGIQKLLFWTLGSDIAIFLMFLGLGMMLIFMAMKRD